MKTRPLFASVLVLAFAGAVGAQGSNSAPPSGQTPGQNSGQGYGQYGRRGGEGGYGGGFGGGVLGRGLIGTVTETAADHYTIKTEAGEVYAVHFSANTRILKQQPGTPRPSGNQGPGPEAGQSAAAGGQDSLGGFGRGNPPQQIKASDIKAGDMIRVMGEVDDAAKSVGAVAVLQIDPATVQQVRQRLANFGKTWLAGNVTAIDGVKLTLNGAVDKVPHTVVADENTELRKRGEPATLADIQIGDNVNVEGAVKDGAFAATSIAVFGGRRGGETPPVPRNASPQ